jgi:CheY-like chemotaxis protein
VKAQEAIKNLDMANAESGGQSQIAGRIYSQLAYIYQALRTPGVFQLAKEERLKYRALEKKSLDSALEYTESNDLRLMLTDLAMDDGQYGKALEHLDMVATNVLADDAVMHRELANRLKKLKAFESAKVAPMLKTEQAWQAEYDAKQKAAAKAQGESTAVTKPFKVGPR